MSQEFLKTYGKHIMAVVSSLLMITFVLTSYNKSSLGRNPATIAKGTLDGKSVTLADVEIAKRDSEVLRALLDHAPRDREHMFSPLRLTYLTIAYRLDRHDPNVHLYLLLQEARKFGIAVSAQEVEQMIRDTGISDTDYEAFRESNNLADITVRRAVADFLSVSQLDSFVLDILPVSVPQLQHLAVDTTATMQVRYIAMDTKSADKMAWTPTPEAQDKQFAAYKGVFPADPAGAQPPLIDGHHYPFGYKYPDRIKLEVLTFDWQQVRHTLKPNVDDYREARAQYNQHPEQYQRKAPETLPDTKAGPATATAPATQEGPTTRPFEEVSAQIIKDILDRRTDQRIKEMTDATVVALKAVWDGFKDDGKGYYSVPPEKWPNYETIASDIEKQFGVRPRLQVFGKEWLSRKALVENLKDSIGGAYLMAQGRPSESFVNLAMNIHELQASPQGLVASLHLQTGVDGPPVADEQHNQYIYRVTAASPSHEPASLDEPGLRPAVLTDLRRVALQAENLKRAQELATEAQRDGLEKVSHVHKLDMKQTDDFTRLRPGGVNPETGQWRDTGPSPVAPLGVVPEFNNAAFRLLAQQIQATPKAEEASPAVPATTRAPNAGSATAAAPMANKTTAAIQVAAVAVDSRLEVFVLQLYKSEPMTTAQFEQQRSALRYAAQRGEISQFRREWYTFPETAKRMKFTPLEPFHTGDAATNDAPDLPDL